MWLIMPPHWLAACVTLIDVCPGEDDRYVPDIDPQLTIENQQATGVLDSDYVCEGNAEYHADGYTERCCTSEWCGEGYSGTYCIDDERFDAWAKTYCPHCRTRDGGVFNDERDDVYCSPQSRDLELREDCN